MTGRLMLRLTRRCNSACAHCTIADLPELDDRSTRDAVEELRSARERGCDAVVFMRGEATLRSDLPRLAAIAQRLGYHTIQLQTNGRMLAYDGYLERLWIAGVNFFEVSLFGASVEVNDTIACDPGAFEQTVAGLRGIVARGAGHLVTVPVLRANLDNLEDTVELLSELGVQMVQFGFTRPVRVEGRYQTEVLVRLDEAGTAVRAAMGLARRRGMQASSEAFPLCQLAEADRPAAESPDFFVGVRVVDLHLRHDSFAEHQRENRPHPAVCANCSASARCSVTWAAYQELHGTEELRPI